ncbi:MAG: hypothetical protein PG981_000897 [Wolbachia endosymbiont of Ctenocephalides orientis wCori]|nr:MAG: hypothetical protein PG981_000897 [Wolbachia endosymbiont of Ctenocephalides orientis wCori]
MRFYKLFHELKAKQFQEINRKDEQGNTILHLATWYASSDKTKFLIEQGGDINARNNKGETPLHMAVDKGKILHVERVIEAGEYKCKRKQRCHTIT